MNKLNTDALSNDSPLFKAESPLGNRRFQRARPVPKVGRAALALAAFTLAACSDQDIDAAMDAESGTGPAVVMAAQVITPDDYLTYVAAFADVPEGEVGLSGFREFGNANVFVNGGYVFVEQDGVMRRFIVTEDFELVEDGPKFSWTEFGITGANASYTVFASETRAYTLAPELGVIIVWDPSEMARITAIDIEYPERPADMETWAFDGYLVGDKVIWNVFSGNFEEDTVYPAVTLVIVDAHTDDPPIFVEDDRCLPGGPSFVDSDGNYFIQGGAFFGYFFAYGDNAEGARTCMLRVNAGETSTDPDFVVDFEELLGSYVSDPWYHVSGDKYVARSWDPEVPLPESSDDFYDNEALRPLLLDISDRTVEPYPDLDDKVGIDGVTREVDGASYYQISETGYVEGGNSEIVELRTDGIHPRFQLDGFLLGLERLR